MRSAMCTMQKGGHLDTAARTPLTRSACLSASVLKPNEREQSGGDSDEREDEQGDRAIVFTCDVLVDFGASSSAFWAAESLRYML